MRRWLPIAVLVLLMMPGAARAGPGKGLWATVNVCDPAGARNVIGVRGGMPGNGTNERLYMHFSAEWYDTSRKRWKATGSSSKWRRVGSARYKATQAGYSFQFADPPRGAAFLMRGVVRYQWRRGNRVVRRATRVTKGGYRGVAGGVPAGRSEAVCAIVH